MRRWRRLQSGRTHGLALWSRSVYGALRELALFLVCEHREDHSCSSWTATSKPGLPTGVCCDRFGTCVQSVLLGSIPPPGIEISFASLCLNAQTAAWWQARKVRSMNCHSPWRVTSRWSSSRASLLGRNVDVAVAFSRAYTVLFSSHSGASPPQQSPAVNARCWTALSSRRLLDLGHAERALDRQLRRAHFSMIASWAHERLSGLSRAGDNVHASGVHNAWEPFFELALPSQSRRGLGRDEGCAFFLCLPSHLVVVRLCEYTNLALQISASFDKFVHSCIQMLDGRWQRSPSSVLAGSPLRHPRPRSACRPV